MPGRGQIVGVVLEDLVEDLTPFTTLVEATSPSFEQISELVRLLLPCGSRGPADSQPVRSQARSAFDLQHRLHQAGVLQAADTELSLHRLKVNWSTFVCLGLSNCRFLDTALALHAQYVARDRRDELDPPHPSDDLFYAFSNDRDMLESSVYGLFGDDESACQRWTDEARADPRLAFLKDDL